MKPDYACAIEEKITRIIKYSNSNPYNIINLLRKSKIKTYTKKTKLHTKNYQVFKNKFLSAKTLTKLLKRKRFLLDIKIFTQNFSKSYTKNQ